MFRDLPVRVRARRVRHVDVPVPLLDRRLESVGPVAGPRTEPSRIERRLGPERLTAELADVLGVNGRTSVRGALTRAVFARLARFPGLVLLAALLTDARGGSSTAVDRHGESISLTLPDSELSCR